MAYSPVHDHSQWYLAELMSRVVAESGRPDDRFHLGKLILRSFKEYPEDVLQIDGTTGESVTNRDVMERSIKCATCFRNMGLNVGDVIVIMSASNMDISVPFYAALFTGVIVAPIDTAYSLMEMRTCFGLLEPKIIFCQKAKKSEIQFALTKTDLNTAIVEFDNGLDDFFDKFGGEKLHVEDFKVTDLNPHETTAFHITTSGSTGKPKVVEATHKNYAIGITYLWSQRVNFPSPYYMSMIVAPMQWVSTVYQYVATPIFRVTRLESSGGLTPEEICQSINTYRPTYTVASYTFINYLMKIKDQCDLTCFKQIHLGGNAIPPSLIEIIKEKTPNTNICDAYGITEISTIALLRYTCQRGTLTVRLGCFHYRLINLKTGKDILEANVSGELWLKGPTIFKGYYKNESITKETFSEDGWFKTGDLFYRDEIFNYHFVERIKLLLKYKTFHVSPMEVESVIRQHPGVMDVAVTAVPDDDRGDLPVACVVRQPGYDDIADEIKTLVKETLSDAKQLRGGVTFLDALPMTSTTKIDRQKLKELVILRKINNN